MPVVDAVVAAGARFPARVALSSEGGELQYGELVARVGGLVATLRSVGLPADARVLIHFERSTELMIAILGTLACGAAYVPADPDSPPARLEEIARDCAPSLLLSDGAGSELAAAVGIPRLDPADWAAEGPVPESRARGLAYIIYTSGSTGTPKGVMIDHAALENYLDWAVSALPFTGDGVPLFASASFDHAITCYFPPLLKGEPLYLLPPVKGGRQLARGLLTGRRYSYIKITPSHARMLDLEQRAELGRSTELLMFGGERLPASLVADVRRDAPDLVVMNHYGPTEATVGCCVHRVPTGVVGSSVPIGRAIPGLEAVVRRPDANVAAVDEPGELHLSGVGLARGYWGQPELTDSAFIELANGGGLERWYRTGDMVVHRADGELEYLGRADDQIKILGHRVEPGEIEHALRLHPQVREAYVVAHTEAEQAELVAGVTLAAGTLDEHQLRRHLRSYLPAALVPSRFAVLENPPLTSHGKVNRAALLAATAPGTRDETTAAIETRIAEWFREVLDLPTADGDSDFFEHGGDSLAAVEAVAWIEDEFGVRLDLAALFRYSTPRALAQHVVGQRDDG